MDIKAKIILKMGSEKGAPKTVAIPADVIEIFQNNILLTCELWGRDQKLIKHFAESGRLSEVELFFSSGDLIGEFEVCHDCRGGTNGPVYTSEIKKREFGGFSKVSLYNCLIVDISELSETKWGIDINIRGGISSQVLKALHLPIFREVEK